MIRFDSIQRFASSTQSLEAWVHVGSMQPVTPFHATMYDFGQVQLLRSAIADLDAMIGGEGYDDEQG